MTMAICGYKTQLLGKEWECSLDALPGEEYCYWHKEEDGKAPKGKQLEELKRNKIVDVYLQKSDLSRANLHGLNLSWANLKGSDLSLAELQGSDLFNSNLQGANLLGANLQGANLLGANLQGSDLFGAKLQGVDLSYANLQGANLAGTNFNFRTVLDGSNLVSADLQGANLVGTKFNSQTDLHNSNLVGANLYHSYVDEARSFRNAKAFQNEGDKEINEIAGDALDSWFIWSLENSDRYPAKIISKITSFVLNKNLNKKLHISLPLKPFTLDMGTIEKNASGIAAKLRWDGLFRYVEESNRIIFFDWSSRCVIENPENMRRDGKSLIKVKELTDLILKDGKIQPEFIYTESRANLYEASYEVYNNLYNLYIANGRLDQATHAHYRSGESHRKLRWVRGGLKNRARSIFDLLILRTLIGYGNRIGRPIFMSGLTIGLFAALFWLSDGIVKNVNGKPAAPDWVDYLYHSTTTFTSLGYSNIQPNLAAGHLPQVLVAAESGLCVLMMMALIIFVVTFKVSR